MLKRRLKFMCIIIRNVIILIFAGHFHIAGPGSLWKQQAKDGEVEAKVLKELNESSLHAYVPDYLGSKEHDGKKWIGMEDVMCHFKDGCGMDIKMGTR